MYLHPNEKARVSAAVPSGVGFLGAGLIVKDIYKDIDGEMILHTIKGLNTAASVWLSAAVGVAAGGGLYFVATFTSALILVLLRFGPRDLVRTDSILGSVLPLHEHTKEESVKDDDRRASSQLVHRNSMKKPSLNYD